MSKYSDICFLSIAHNNLDITTIFLDEYRKFSIVNF